VKTRSVLLPDVVSGNNRISVTNEKTEIENEALGGNAYKHGKSRYFRTNQ
jgi:hypothetical protein